MPSPLLNPVAIWDQYLHFLTKSVLLHLSCLMYYNRSHQNYYPNLLIVFHHLFTYTKECSVTNSLYFESKVKCGC